MQQLFLQDDVLTINSNGLSLNMETFSLLMLQLKGIEREMECRQEQRPPFKTIPSNMEKDIVSVVEKNIKRKKT